MHEYSIVASLIDRVQREAAAHGGAHVHRLHVRIGELSGVEIDLLETAFDTFREKTICASAELVIETVRAAWECPACGLPFEQGAILRCPTCEKPAELAGGDEIILQRIEMETRNV